jgi:hypothetical protein
VDLYAGTSVYEKKILSPPSELTLMMGQYAIPKHRSAPARLRGAISQKAFIFRAGSPHGITSLKDNIDILTAVRTTSLTRAS